MILFFFEIFFNSLIFADCPYKFTGIITLVFFVIFFLISEVFIKKSFSLISTKTGFAPVLTIAEIVGTAVLETVITSSPFLIPRANKAINIASVPLLTPTANLFPMYLEKFFSRFLSSFPRIKFPELKTLFTNLSI